MQELPLIVTYIIDDDKLHQHAMSRMLKYIKTPVHLIQFYNGLQAIEYIKENMPEWKHLPDAIFLDINMPVMNGWQFLDEFIPLLPKQNCRTTIYIVTSSVSDADIEKAASYSEISEYIIKPTNVEQVQKIFEELSRKQVSALN